MWPDSHTHWPVQRGKGVLVAFSCLKQACIFPRTFYPQSTDMSELGIFGLSGQNMMRFAVPEVSYVSSESTALSLGRIKWVCFIEEIDM